MGLYKRGKVWWMSFYYKGKQRRQSTETTDKKLAEMIYYKAVTQVSDNKLVISDEKKERTFKELVDKYRYSVFRELRNWKKTECYLNQLEEFLGPYALSQINPALIDDFKQMRKQNGVTPATVNRQLTILRRMLNLARKRWMWIEQVPPVEMEPRADKKRVRHLSFDEFHLLINCCEDWLKDIVTVAAWTGLRRGNIINLQRSQVNLFAGTITLDGSEMKNEENLTFPLSTPAFEALKRAMKVTHLNSSFVFCKEDGSSYTGQQVHRGFKRALKSAGVKDFRFHDLRHCFASWNRQAGVDLDTLADLMGHKDTRMTRRYAHITPLHLKKAVGLLDDSYLNAITKQSQFNHTPQKKELANGS